jgi:hypothetical protein
MASVAQPQMNPFQERLDYLKHTLGRPWPRRLLSAWGILAAWDTFVSQFIPEGLAKSFPKVSWAYGWLPLWAWVPIGALIVAVSSIEYGLHHKIRYDGNPGASNIRQRPLVPTWLIVSLLVIILTPGLIYVGYLGFYLSDELTIKDFAKIQAVTESVVSNPTGYPDHFAVNIFTINSSKEAKLINQHFNYSWITSSTATEAGKSDIDGVMNNLLKRTKEARGTANTSEIEPLAKTWYSAYGEKSFYDRNILGNGSLYLLVVFEYKDKFIHKDKWWVTELCWRIFKNNSLVRCVDHNRTYQSD